MTIKKCDICGVEEKIVEDTTCKVQYVRISIGNTTMESRDLCKRCSDSLLQAFRVSIPVEGK